MNNQMNTKFPVKLAADNLPRAANPRAWPRCARCGKSTRWCSRWGCRPRVRRIVPLVCALLLAATAAQASCWPALDCNQPAPQSNSQYAQPWDGSYLGDRMGLLQYQQQQRAWQQYQSDLQDWRVHRQLQNQYLLEHMGPNR